MTSLLARSVTLPRLSCRRLQYRHLHLRSRTPSMSSTKPQVLVTRGDVPQKALDKLKDICDLDIYPETRPIPRNVLLERIQGKNALFCLLTDKIDKDILDAAGEKLKIICTMSVGYDHLSLEEIKSRGIKVGYTPGVLTDATAELTIALLLATSRRLFEAHQELVRGGWGAWSPMWMTGMALSNSTVGIFGLGRIGQAVAQRLRGFNVRRFLYSGRSRKKEGDEMGLEFVPFDTLLSESDFVIITSALTEETAGAFGREAFARMKPSAILVNTSRGGLVDQEALIDALKTGKIRAAGLDVMTPEPLPLDHPLISTPNLTLLPHIGSADVSTREGMAVLTAENLIAGLKGDPMPQALC